jgi:hypothetical protein
MKLSEIKVNGEYAIIPSWTYTNKSARSVDTVRENDVVKATVVSVDKYDYEPSNRKATPDFNKAQAGNRSVGILVKAIDNSGSEVFWTSRLADVIAEWSELAPKWEAKKLVEDAEQRKREEKANQERDHRRKVDEEVNRSRNSVISSSKELLGDQTHVEVEMQGYGVESKAVVSLSLAEYERLVEMAFAGKDNN